MTPIINLSHINYNYEEVSALNDISLEIYAGELIFFTGPNGCGKSTLFKLLNGLIFPTKGEYYFDNKKIDKNTLQDNMFAKNFHKRIGYIFQNPDVQLFNATVYDEIAFGPRQMNLNEEIIHQRINELLIYLNMELGDVRKTPFDEIWKNSEVLNKLRTFEFEGNCGKCKYKFSCGGCRARAAYYNDGNYMAEEPWCLYSHK